MIKKQQSHVTYIDLNKWRLFFASDMTNQINSVTRTKILKRYIL